MQSATITRTGARRRRRSGAKPFLFVALDCGRPLQPGARFCLEGSASVSIGRAPALSAAREGEELRIGLPDARISSAHLRIESVLGRFVAADCGSKNGTLLDGRRIERLQLFDGALLELGHTFLLFRDSLPAADAAVFLDGSKLEPAAPGLATLVPAIAAEFDRLRLVAQSRVAVLLQGESGTGKEVLASAVHRLSGRAGPLRAVNCGAIAPNLVESELFGHRRGAFSGAVEDQLGLVRAAHRGTLLLDEVGDLPLSAQATLLRVLQEEEVLPVGASTPVKVDLRVVAATHRDLDALVAQQRFRPDLLARLSGYSCTLPPLRDRCEDFSLLVAALLARIGARDVVFDPEAARALLRYHWPLNIRELERCLAGAAVLAKGGEIEPEHLPPAVLAAPAPPAHDSENDRRREELLALLRQYGGNVTTVARALGKARTQVQRWLHRFRIDPLSFR